MDELGRIAQALAGFPSLVVLFLLTYVILKTPAGLLIVKKLFGTNGNGNGRGNSAVGEITVDFWRSAHREIVEGALEDHEKDETMRYDALMRNHNELRKDMIEMLKAIESVQRETIAESRRGVDRIVDGLAQLALRVR